jgi:hypothetical protein
VLLLCSLLKSILGRSSKVKESIEDPFKYETWLGGVHIGLCKSVRYDRCIGYMSVTVYVLALSSNCGFPGYGCPGGVFLLIEFPFH